MQRQLKRLALLLPGVLLLSMQAVNAQSSSPPPATATRPAENTPGQTSVPNDSGRACHDRRPRIRFDFES